MTKSLEHRLQVLLDCVIDGSSSDAERQEFSELLEQHGEIVTPLITQLRMHSLLQWKCSTVDVDDSEFLESHRAALSQLCESTRPPNKQRLSRWVISIAAALLGVAAIVAWRSGFRTIGPDLSTAIAEVVDDEGVVWSDHTTALRAERSIYPGKLQFDSGTLTLRFRTGVNVVFRGASSMTIESDMLVRLDRGQATAQVPQWAKGFTIETPNAAIVDLGTQFGVMARGDGKTDVVIFEGEVDVKPTGRKSAPKRLNQGEAASIQRDGEINRIVEVRGNTKQGWSTSDDPRAARDLFRAIRDNVPPSDGSKYFYYQITKDGLVEDAPAYVDRHPHQWNGLTLAGLPDFLRGADYTRTFNDYRYMKGFELVVELAGPADLYVFFDDRVPTPSWLLERFEDTGINIGLDEGPWEGIPDHRTAIGAGNSIDNLFSVWRRRCEKPEAVTLGAVGDSNEARAMYGIAAVPLEPKWKSRQPIDGEN